MQSVTLPQPITRENKSRIRLQTVFEMWKIEIRNLLYVFTNFLQSESNITVLTDVQKKKKRNHYVYLILTCKRQEWHAPSPWIRHGRRETREMIVTCEMPGITCMISGTNTADWGLSPDGMLTGLKSTSGNFRPICRSAASICLCEPGNIKVFNSILFKRWYLSFNMKTQDKSCLICKSYLPW